MHAHKHIRVYIIRTNQLGKICAQVAGVVKLSHKYSCILNTHCYKELYTHIEVWSLVPQKVILHSLYNSGSINRVKHYLLFVADTE